MGENAEDIIDGTVCEICTCEYFKTHDHPVVCKDCWKDLSVIERENRTLAYNDSLTG